VPVLLPNVYVWTARRSYNSGTQSSGPAVPALTKQLAHMEPTRSETDDLMPMRAGAVRTEVVAYFEPGTDIRKDDFVTSITLLDGVTPWPQLNLSALPNESYIVSLILEGTPGPLEQRQAIISRYIKGGIAPT
jgi:hypothetical protein